MRSLAHIERITDIQPIEGKDLIVYASVLGWGCIIQKDEFQMGDLAVYVEIDSVLSEKPEFEFLRKRCFVDNGVVRGFRIRSLKMGNVISQGILFPLSILPPGNYSEGQDVTETLGIVLYENRETKEAEERSYKQLIAGKKGWWFRIKRLLHLKTSMQWPEWVTKTDEPRLQNMPQILEDDGDFYISEKAEGQSLSFSNKDGKEYLCSRTQVKEIRGGNFLEKILALLDNFILGSKFTGNSNWQYVAEKYDLWNRIPKGYTIQAEVIGQGIQGNIYQLKDFDMLVFNVELIGFGTLPLDQMLAFCEKHGLKTVPILNEKVKLNTKTLQEWLDYADGESVLYPTLREGIVFKKHTTDGSKVSFKIRSNKYLLKHGE